MPGCVLRVGGEDLDPEVIPGEGGLKACLIPRRERAGSPSEKKVNRGFNLNVSVAGGDDLAAQVKDAVAFLAKHEGELRGLRSMPGVTGMSLDFGCWQKDVAAQYLRFSPELLALAGGLGIGLELSLYAVG